MTILTTTIWGGRVSLVADRQISRKATGSTQVVATDASKALVVLCGNALFTVAYTGVATAKSIWLDEAIAGCLAFKPVKAAMVQPGSWFLARPVHELLKNLAFNLPIRLRSDPSLASEGLTLAVAGWHLRPRLQPFVWELGWASAARNIGGSMSITQHKVAKHFRHFRGGLWLQTWGDTGEHFEEKMRSLTKSEGLTHDDVERFIVNSIAERSRETLTVGDECIAVQLDPLDREGHVQFSYYPGAQADDPNSLLSGWLLTPTMISAPTRETTRGGTYSLCSRYITGGFYDMKAKLAVRTRLPVQAMRHGGPVVLGYSVAPRTPPPTPTR